ncbi:UDP-N-acetylmuramate--L-alanine ligase [Kiritimatiella glycovorans]|uniref:UDP-N-acetylmuramate--L-alanine ligase n=1 Tax=Kiritimatiella glycovorans TaxID=1307763 RepID=A0A0G3ED35_9BACT|nr:Mur ligase domain-containing protein [Kiritimatiella glycovorans]AKJ64376.1 UDP-N-acetylmuramate--L-alanine ligase [Kiritimatiella glycovorans]
MKARGAASPGRELFRKAPAHLHLVGCGGAGMAGLAGILLDRGFRLSGCDLHDHDRVRRLAERGMAFMASHDPGHIRDLNPDAVVRSAAVSASEPEIRAAMERGIPVLRRGEALPGAFESRTGVAVAGSHGKTTTTALLVRVMETAGIGCGYAVGGDLPDRADAGRDGDPVVLEADESDGTVALYEPDVAIVTSIEPDHMEHHADEDAFVECFRRLIDQTSGPVFYYGDDPGARGLCAGIACAKPYHERDLAAWPLARLPGRHNRRNAAAAALAARYLGVPEAAIRRGLESASLPKRRYERISESGGVRVVADYAHHPTEIRALIELAREEGRGRILAAFQPHRYTRTRNLREAFPPALAGVDRLWLLPVYPAFESPLPGGRSRDLAASFPADFAAKRLREADDPETAAREIDAEAQPGDTVLIIGAGDIERMADYWRAPRGRGEIV